MRSENRSVSQFLRRSSRSRLDERLGARRLTMWETSFCDVSRNHRKLPRPCRDHDWPLTASTFSCSEPLLQPFSRIEYQTRRRFSLTPLCALVLLASSPQDNYAPLVPDRTRLLMLRLRLNYRVSSHNLARKRKLNVDGY